MPTGTTAGTLSARRRRELAELRLVAQGVVDQSDGTTAFSTPAQVAEHLVCAQAQHLPGVREALALRLSKEHVQEQAPATVGGAEASEAPADDVGADAPAAGAGDDASESAARDVPDARVGAVTTSFAEGTVVRGYPMRGTVFAAGAADLAWMTELTRERQLAAAARRRREHGLDDALLAELGELCRRIVAEAGGAIGREQLGERLAELGHAVEGGRRYHLLYTLIVLGVLAYGPLRDGEALVVDAEAWLPAHGTLDARFNGDADAAVAEWLRRYLAGHGPASLREFQWWTKLPLGLLRRVEAQAVGDLEQYGEDALGEALWGAPGLQERRSLLGGAVGAGRLLPAFDEVVLGYPDRELIVDAEHLDRIVPGANGVFRPTAHRRGSVVGTWRTEGPKRARRLGVDSFAPLPATAHREFERAWRDYPHPA